MKGRSSIARKLLLPGVALALLCATSAHLVIAQIRAVQQNFFLGDLVAEIVAPSANDPQSLAGTLDRLRDKFGVELSVYRREPGRDVLVASTAHPPLSAAGVEPIAHDGLVYAVAFDRRWHPANPLTPYHHPLIFPAINFACFLVGVSLFGVIVARWVVAPLRILARAARAFGSGDLGARSGLDRADELGDVGRAFDEMGERVQSLLRAEKELLANVSHELRTPLARIRVALDLAAEGNADAARASLSEIAVDVTEVESLVEDIFTATRLALLDGRSPHPTGFKLRIEPASPEAMVELVAQRFTVRHAGRPLEVSIDSGLGKLDVDVILFRRVFDNLLENAHKYCADPGAPIALTARRVAEGVEFVVRDRGVGIAPEDLPHVFDAFFRSERSRSRDSGGVGLGLTLAKRIVEAHRGTITIDSDQGGTNVHIRVPSPT